jgi:hypothetical protein
MRGVGTAAAQRLVCAAGWAEDVIIEFQVQELEEDGMMQCSVVDDRERGRTTRVPGKHIV